MTESKLIAVAIEDTGASTKQETVESGLGALIQMMRQERIRGLWENLEWNEKLDRMRLDA